MTTQSKPPLSTEEKGEKILEPAKAWRNKWMCREAGMVHDSVSRRITFTNVDEVFWSDGVWPSKDVCEQKALEIIRTNKARGHVPDKYLGAFPIP